MKRSQLVTALTNAIALATNQTWRDNRHTFGLIRQAVERTLPTGDLVVAFTTAQAYALHDGINYRLENAGEGDHADVVGSKATMMQRAARRLDESLRTLTNGATNVGP